MLDTNARILGHELMERIRQSLLVSAALRRNRVTEHRWRKGDRLEVVVILIVRVMQNRVQVQLYQLRNSTDVTRNRVGHFLRIFTHQFHEMGNLDRLTRIADKNLASLT